MGGDKKIPDTKMTSFKFVFDTWDSNHDGVISKGELGTLLRACGLNPSEADLKLFMDELDQNGDGVIDFNEFIRFASSLFKDESSEAILKEAFDFFDKDKDGKISAEELREVLTSCGEPLSEEEAKDVLRMGDLNGDGFLDIDEFIKVLHSFN